MGIKVDSTSHGIDDRFRLFVYLLLHKVVKLSLHDLRELNLESLDGSNRGDSVIPSQSVDVKFYCSATAANRASVLTTLGNVGDVVVLKVEDSLCVLNDGRGIRRDEVFDGLRHAIFSHEGSRLRSSDLGSCGVGSIGAQGNIQESAHRSVIGYTSAKP